ncbi:hypothetical protein BKA70DRAFT_1228184 [Coprinopsis sp. MPI-PUGE-AT-0042]|nr:hypothetical protein BKA70DRAFT_1228184 [Coprinopsis sp. MPI-PUGE-AT-0042]
MDVEAIIPLQRQCVGVTSSTPVRPTKAWGTSHPSVAKVGGLASPFGKAGGTERRNMSATVLEDVTHLDVFDIRGNQMPRLDIYGCQVEDTAFYLHDVSDLSGNGRDLGIDTTSSGPVIAPCKLTYTRETEGHQGCDLAPFCAQTTFIPEIMDSNTFNSYQPDQSEVFVNPMSGIYKTHQSDSEAKIAMGVSTRNMQALIEAQQREISNLKSQAKKFQRRSDIFREKAITFRALYSQQQMVSEMLVESIVALRDRHNLTDNTGWSSEYQAHHSRSQ